MPLTVGEFIGPYEVAAHLGSGGMGEVYCARDRKLDRDVALKVLGDAFAADAERLARFRHEARLLASLSHPNIGQIYGFEDSGAAHALVLELIPGDTLAERIARGRLPLGEALSLAQQIADALDAAHERGIIHRDLKPANIKVRPDGVVKVLDFGLAKALEPAPAGRAAATDSPTFTSPAHLTQSGVILGTAAYMSPEQARGQHVDKRTDIWAFGCVLYEMLTGRVAFNAATVSDTIVTILSGEPEWAALPADTPESILLLLRRCLEKDPKRRLRDIGDVRIELDHIQHRSGKVFASGGGSPSMRQVEQTAGVRARRLPYVVSGLVLAIAVIGAAAFYWPRDREVLPPPTEYTQITNFTDSATAPSLSRDGRMVTFIRGGEAFLSEGQIYVKLLPNGEARALTTGSNSKYAPVFTPDGSRVAYTEVVDEPNSWDTWTVPVFGGPARLLLPNASGLTWIGDQEVLFAEIKGDGFHMGVSTASETRAQSREIYWPDHESAMAHYAYLSPDRQSVLVVEMDRTHTFNQPCRLVPFDGSSTGRPVGPKGFCTAAAWSPDGAWMYFGATVGRGSHIWRQRFPDGTPEQITSGPSEEEGIAIAPDGRSLITSIGTRRSAIWIHDASGDRQLSFEGFAGAPRVSHDASRVYFLYLSDLSSPVAELRSLDLTSGRIEHLLPGVSVADYDVSRDGSQIAYTATDVNGESSIWIASTDRRSAPRQLVQGGDSVSFGAEGELVFRSLEQKTANVLGRIRTDGSHRERLTTVAVLDKFGVSPDGRWAIVYAVGDETTEPGTVAVPLRGGPPVKICQLCPSDWSRDGRYLYVAIEQSAMWSPRASWARAGSTSGKTLAIPMRADGGLPELPAGGIGPEKAGADVKHARLIPHGAIAPGPDPSTYAFAKTELQRNLYRIPLR